MKKCVSLKKRVVVFAIAGGGSTEKQPSKINSASNAVESAKDENEKTKKVLYENEDYKVTYLDFEDKNLGITMLYLNLKVENNSDSGITVTFEDAYMNDTSIQFISGFPLEILPGKNAVAANGFGYDGKGIDGIEDVTLIQYNGEYHG